ncbi:DUF5347 domain-containing protein, partial [Enterobacter hormaechei]|nr:DUF5347 domain-containing protein [Enterobacter hormaechei]
TDGDGSHGSTSKTPSYTKSVSWHHYPQFEENNRALAAIFFLAKIPAARHELQLSELTTDEKKALITAMNHFRAVVSLFPKRLTMPN